MSPTQTEFNSAWLHPRSVSGRSTSTNGNDTLLSVLTLSLGRDAIFFCQCPYACPPETVWEVLTDASSYPKWAVGIHRLEGQIAEGKRLQPFTISKPQSPMTLRVRNLVRPRTLTLSGGLPLNLFRGDRTFTLIPQPDSTTEFRMCEVFSGPLSPVLGRIIPDLTASFEACATGLKNWCENQR
ncbi:MAG: SRPBCC family protein [Leptolyngbyaceae cyanobacterium]